MYICLSVWRETHARSDSLTLTLCSVSSSSSSGLKASAQTWKKKREEISKKKSLHENSKQIRLNTSLYFPTGKTKSLFILSLECQRLKLCLLSEQAQHGCSQTLMQKFCDLLNNLAQQVLKHGHRFPFNWYQSITISTQIHLQASSLKCRRKILLLHCFVLCSAMYRAKH